MDCLCRPSRIMSIRINLLDETDFLHEIKDDLPGQALLDVVFARLNLIETSYFGIRYIDDENQTHWLDPASRISRQLKPKSDPYDLYFGVKFYAADPCKLLEEITRYQLFLQVKQDVLQGRLPLPFELAAELGAFVVQSELGDYDQRRHSKGYVSEFRLLPQQSSELEQRVAELHQQLKGMSPAQAEMNYLDKVKWHDMYGVDLHPVLGEDSVEYFLGLTPSGIVVLRNKTTVAHYYWPRIAKVYYKGRYFMLRISDKNNDLSTYGFETPRKPACKHLWRCCVEHHAFFRAVRVAPLPTSQSNTSDLFQLGSRLKYSSGRSEKQAAKDALNIGRAPPAFTRVPSKRQPRRVIDDFLNGVGAKRSLDGGAPLLEKHSSMKASTLATMYESPYRSTYSIPTSLGVKPYSQQQQSYQQQPQQPPSNDSNLQTPDSPRSTRSAPWPRSQQRSLFGNKPSSPRSVRSASTTGGNLHHHHHHHNNQHNSNHHNNNHHHQQQQPQRHSSQSSQYPNNQQQRDHVPSHQQRYRSSSVESHSSNDSRSTRRHKHRHRRTSDNESELSRGSGRSGRSHHRKHRRSRHRRDSAGSDRESSRGRSYSGHRTSSARSGSAELIDSTSQWREVQRRQAEASLGLSSVQQASVTKSSMVARSLHSNDSHSDTHSHHKSRRHRKNKSPSDSRTRHWNSELAKHLQFDLVETAGMTEDQLREIPYTVVETNSKRSTSNLKIHKSNSKNSVGGKSNCSGNTLTNGSGSTKEHGKNRVDRIRGLYFQNSNPSDSTGAKNGSIRSASTISSRECERNTGLVRMMSSMSMGDFISPTGSNLSPLENSALRVSHEHTDSGLGADQDYAYSSERSSDSTRYGTNKSSGASSGSHRKCAGPGSSSTYNSLMQQTVSSQQHHQQKQQQQQQQQQPYFSQRQNSQKHNYKYSSSQQQQTNPQTNQTQPSLAPIHNSHSNHYPTSAKSSNSNNTNNNSINSNSNHGHGNEMKGQQQQQQHKASSTNSCSNSNNSKSSKNSSSSIGNRLLSYTTFENNQYKFSLNNAFRRSGSQNGVSNLSCGVGTNLGGVGSLNAQKTNNQMDSFVEWPNTPAAPYYYNGPTTTMAIKKRDAKSDIGVPTRRFSGQAMTKTQLLTGGVGGGSQLANASCYPMPAPSYTGITFDSRLHPAKSDLFLSYLHATPNIYEYERPYIYNYKMPQMPDFLRTAGNTSQQQQQHQQPQQQSNTAYHISGAQTADLPPPSLSGVGPASSNSNSSSLLYGGATPATDVLYYQFDNGKCKSPPIVHQPKSVLNKTAGDAATMSQLPQVGPLVYLQHGQNIATNSQQTTCTTTNTTNSTTNSINSHSHSTCSEEDIDECDEEDYIEEESHDDEKGAAIQQQTAEQQNEYIAEATAADDMQQYVSTDNDSTIKSMMATTPNNNSNAIQLLSPTSNNTNEKENPSDIGTTNVITTKTTSSPSMQANINLDNCNANMNLGSNNNGNNNYAIGTSTATISTLINPNSYINSTSSNSNSNIKTLNANQQQQQQQLNSNQFPNHNSTQNLNQNRNPPSHANVNSMNSSLEQQNRNISSSLEIILSPIIQSSRRAQLLEK